MADNEYTPQKVRLMTPDTAPELLYLYPVTGINAITVGTTTSGGAYTTYVAPEGKLLAPYMDIMTTTPTTLGGTTPQYKVRNDYLDFITSANAIDESYLKFIVNPSTSSAYIDPAYLPGFVDDIVEVPITSDSSHPSSGNLLISAIAGTAGTTYWFYEKNTSGGWDLGGGESGKLYVGEGTQDGAIYRAANTSSAVKINETPFIIDETVVNGVHLLTQQDNHLSAVANLATVAAPGTIQISSEMLSSSPLKNVWFSLTGGVLNMSESLGNANNAGILFAAGTQQEYNALSSGGRPAISIVPTVDWMQTFVSSSIVGVSSATYDNLGLVQIQSGGNIIVSSGIISVPNATSAVAGVVQIVDTINTATAGNSSKAVTQGGIVAYMASTLSSYQNKLTPGNGIDINASNVISVKKTGDGLAFNGSGQLYLTSATATSMGGVLITGDSSYITGGTATVDGKPVAVNGAAVKDYVDYRFNNYTPTLPVATSATSGTVVIREIASSVATDPAYYVPSTKDVKTAIAGATTGVIDAIYNYMMVAGDGIDFTKNSTSAIPQITVAAAIDINETALYLTTAQTNQAKLAIHLATDSQLGVVKAGTGLSAAADGTLSIPQITTTEEFAVASNSSKMATVSAISSFVTSQIAGLRQMEAGTAIDISSGTSADTISVKYAAPLTLTSGGSLTVPFADAATAGVIRLGSGLTSRAGGSGIVDVAIATSAGYVDTPTGNTSGGVEVPLGGVRVVTGSGIAVQSGNLYLTPATSSNLGGVMKAATNTGIDITAAGVVSAKIDTNVMSFTASNQISVKEATTSSGGIVTVLTDASQMGSATQAYKVPVASAVTSFVSASISAALPTVVSGSGIQINTVESGLAIQYQVAAVVSSPLLFSGGAISINTATANISGTVGPSVPDTLGAVYVVGTGIRSDFTGVNYTANTVPTESAVRTAINAIPYITWEPMN